MGQLNSIIVFLPFFIMMGLLMFMNKRRENKKMQMISNLKEGSEVVTIGGIKGTVIRVNEETIDIKVGKGTEIAFIKSAISSVKTT